MHEACVAKEVKPLSKGSQACTQSLRGKGSQDYAQSSHEKEAPKA